MPNEPMDVLSWFICLEKLYDQLSVPAELRAVLLRPYLSDRAKTLLARCDVDKSADYAAIKKYLLQEMKLSPTVYLDKFNSALRENSETFQQFSMRLLALFEFYVQGRKINASYDRLLELIIYDRIKSVLPPFLARHVLALEAAHSDQWLGRKGLVESLDAYLANSNFNTKSTGRPDQLPKPVKAIETRVASETASHGADTGQRKNQPVESNWRNGGPSSGVAKRCWICQGNHLRHECPHRGQTPTGKGRGEPFTPRVNKCEYRGRFRLSRKSESKNVSSDQCKVQTPCDEAGPANPELSPTQSEAQPDVASSADVNASVSNDSKSSIDQILADRWSKLHYLDVNIDGLSRDVAALDDSGAQICVIHTNLAQQLQLPVIGQVAIH